MGANGLRTANAKCSRGSFAHARVSAVPMRGVCYHPENWRVTNEWFFQA